MFNLITASAYLLLIHFGVSGTRLRDALVARLDEGPYRGAFSFASLIGLVLDDLRLQTRPHGASVGSATGLTTHRVRRKLTSSLRRADARRGRKSR
jgi:hypothetical protein